MGRISATLIAAILSLSVQAQDAPEEIYGTVDGGIRLFSPEAVVKAGGAAIEPGITFSLFSHNPLTVEDITSDTPVDSSGLTIPLLAKRTFSSGVDVGAFFTVYEGTAVAEFSTNAAVTVKINTIHTFQNGKTLTTGREYVDRISGNGGTIPFNAFSSITVLALGAITFDDGSTGEITQELLDQPVDIEITATMTTAASETLELLHFDHTFVTFYQLGGAGTDIPAIPDASAADLHLASADTSGGFKWAAPPIGLPSGGNNGQCLTRTSSGYSWGACGSGGGLPSLTGNPGRHLTVNLAANAVEWTNPPIGLPTGGSTGQCLTRTSTGYSWGTCGSGGGGVPTFAGADAGKYLRVNFGGSALEWDTRFAPAELGTAGQCLKTNVNANGLAWGTCDSTPSSFPSFTGNATKHLAVNNAANGVIWVDAPTPRMLSDHRPLNSAPAARAGTNTSVSRSDHVHMEELPATDADDRLHLLRRSSLDTWELVSQQAVTEAGLPSRSAQENGVLRAVGNTEIIWDTTSDVVTHGLNGLTGAGNLKRLVSGSDGALSWQDAHTAFLGGLPAITGQAGKVLTVNAGATAAVWETPGGGGGGGGGALTWDLVETIDNARIGEGTLANRLYITQAQCADLQKAGTYWIGFGTFTINTFDGGLFVLPTDFTSSTVAIGTAMAYSPTNIAHLEVRVRNSPNDCQFVLSPATETWPTGTDSINIYKLAGGGGGGGGGGEDSRLPDASGAGNYLRVAANGSAYELGNPASTAAPAPVAATAATGTSNQFARADHAHAGVTSAQVQTAYGQAVQASVKNRKAFTHGGAINTHAAWRDSGQARVMPYDLNQLSHTAPVFVEVLHGQQVEHLYTTRDAILAKTAVSDGHVPGNASSLQFGSGWHAGHTSEGLLWIASPINFASQTIVVSTNIPIHATFGDYANTPTNLKAGVWNNAAGTGMLSNVHANRLRAWLFEGLLNRVRVSAIHSSGSGDSAREHFSGCELTFGLASQRTRGTDFISSCQTAVTNVTIWEPVIRLGKDGRDNSGNDAFVNLTLHNYNAQGDASVAFSFEGWGN